MRVREKENEKYKWRISHTRTHTHTLHSCKKIDYEMPKFWKKHEYLQNIRKTWTVVNILQLKMTTEQKEKIYFLRSDRFLN